MWRALTLSHEIRKLQILGRKKMSRPAGFLASVFKSTKSCHSLTVIATALNCFFIVSKKASMTFELRTTTAPHFSHMMWAQIKLTQLH